MLVHCGVFATTCVVTQITFSNVQHVPRYHVCTSSYCSYVQHVAQEIYIGVPIKNYFSEYTKIMLCVCVCVCVCVLKSDTTVFLFIFFNPWCF